MTKKGFDYEECYLKFDGEIFAIAENKKNAKVIGETLIQLFDENEQLKSENLKLFNALKSMCDVEICQVCKHNELLVFESMMYPTEYDTRCKKGFTDEDGKYYGIEVHECDCFEVREEW